MILICIAAAVSHWEVLMGTKWPVIVRSVGEGGRETERVRVLTCHRHSYNGTSDD